MLIVVCVIGVKGEIRVLCKVCLYVSSNWRLLSLSPIWTLPCKQTCILRQSPVKSIRASETPKISSSTEQRHTHALTHTSFLWRGYSRTKKTTSVSTEPTDDWSKYFSCLHDCFALALTYSILCMNGISGKYLFLYHVALGGKLSSCITVWYQNCGFWPQVVADDS